MKNQKIPKNPIDSIKAGLGQMLSLFNISVKKNLSHFPMRSRPWMIAIMDLAHSFLENMCIYLRGRNIRVTEHQLD